MQGRITDGTLFPNISTAISKEMDDLVNKTFRSLRATVGAILKLVKSDLDMALASGPQCGSDDAHRGGKDDERLRLELAGEVEKLKLKHLALLGNIASL